MAQPGAECMAVDGLDGATLVRTRGGREDVARHAHRSLVISAVTAGHRCVRAHGQQCTSGPGSVLVISPGMVHSCRSEGLHAQTLCLPRSVMPSPFPYVGLFILRDEHASALVRTTWAALAGPCLAPTDEQARRQVLDTLFNLLAGITPQHFIPAAVARASSGVRRVRSRIDQAPEVADGRTLAELAGMSAWGLNKAFARSYGMPPHSYGLHRRIERAKQLLVAGRAAAHVALETGFTDQSHFSRHFKRLVGLTPGRYARALSKGGAA